MSYTKKLFYFLISIFCYISCDNSSKLENKIQAFPLNLKIDRFDKKFMNITKEKFSDFKSKYQFLFSNNFTDSMYLDRIEDSIQKEIQSSIDSVFADFKSTEKDLISLYKHIKYYNPSLKIPTLITVNSDIDYLNKIIPMGDSIVLINIDNYLGSEHKFYLSFPKWIRKNLEKDQIVMDLADIYASRWINQPRRLTFLDQMIYEGKKLYLKDLWIPKSEDFTKIGYKSDELEWVKNNEIKIWEYFNEQELFFSTDRRLLNRFINPGPFSKFYRNIDQDSPASIGKYFGWQIVKSYIKNNDVSLLELLQKDSETIFKKLKFKPKISY